jgi:hypothetical protein
MTSPTPTLDRTPTERPRPRPPTGRRGFVIALIVLLVAGFAVLAALFFLGDEAGEPTPEPAPEIVYGEEARANWDVTGLEPGELLNVRDEPGVTGYVIATLSYDTVELESTGRIAHVNGALWREIVVPGATTGWVNARYLTETAPPAAGELPGPVVETISQIEQAARAEDWDRLAALALQGGTPFTATFGEELTTTSELAAYWRGLATEEDLPRILTGLLGLPDWYPTQAAGADGADVTIYVTPRFMHDPTDASRAALESALGAEWLELQMVDGQYLGWRIGITAGGDWQFFVQGD